jgi:hypothetical protein
MTQNRPRLGVAAAATIVAGLVVGGAVQPLAQGPPAALVTSPRQQFGHDIGDDYRLVNYTQYVEYLHKLDRESDRMRVVDIGPTAEGRREYTAIVTSPANHRRLEEYKEINRRLARAEDLDDDRARALAREGKVVVWIDGGLHANEVLGAQQLIETIYRLNSRTDDETLRILDDDIVLLTLVNPDGMELVSDWYMREADERRRTTAGLPRLYQKYIGHDNNRDFYMMNQPESENANRIMYREWYPAIMYNHHQTGPAGAVLFAPPFRDPFNYHFDPLIPLGIEMVGAAMHTRLAVEGKPGAVMREAASYSTWWNGGLRTMAYFHNQIGILTEMIGNPTPVQIPFVPELQLPSGNVPNPIAPQAWHFRQSIEYSISTNYAILDIASKRKDDFLFNMYKMGKNAIEKGSRDHWTVFPKRIDAVRAAMGDRRPGAGARGTAPADLFETILRDPALRDPRGYILPADQPDFPTATKFVNILIKGGVDVHRATSPFAVGGKSYPAGSYVVKTAQPFRAHVMDMFEPQDHPNDFPYPGGPPTPPYDVTGYNLSYSMGIAYDRVLEGFDGPFEKLSDVVAPPPGRVEQVPAGGAYVLDARVNDAFIGVNRLLSAGEDVWRVTEPFAAGGRSYPAGTLYVPAKASTLPIAQKLAAANGLDFDAVPAVPSVGAARLKPVRIGLWDAYGGSMPSGWTRWLLEQFEFPFEVVFPQALDAGNLAGRFDVLIFVTGGIPEREPTSTAQPPPESVPVEYRDRLGRVTLTRTVPRLREFVEAGGTLLAIGSSTAIGDHFGLPIRDALVEQVGGREVRLPREKFYVPGSILEARVDTSHPLAYGLAERVHVFFDESPAFRLLPEASAKGIRAVAWFDTPAPLRSGWAWGEHHLDQAVQIIDAPVGKGRVVLFAPEIAWRAQPHGTFKLLFNGIYHGR